MNKENIKVPKYVLDDILRTLGLWASIKNSKELKSCLDRDTMTNILQVQKLLNGEDITGMERTEIYKMSFPSTDFL